MSAPFAESGRPSPPGAPASLGSTANVVQKIVDVPEADRPAPDRPGHSRSTAWAQSKRSVLPSGCSRCSKVRLTERAEADDMPIGELPAGSGQTMQFTGISIPRVQDGLITEEIDLDDGVTVLH